MYRTLAPRLPCLTHISSGITQSTEKQTHIHTQTHALYFNRMTPPPFHFTHENIGGWICRGRSLAHLVSGLHRNRTSNNSNNNNKNRKKKPNYYKVLYQALAPDLVPLVFYFNFNSRVQVTSINNRIN